tara:strand:+ start:264 stop:911 length:648 start_codon:yes stop_codon:yes gene_type:complete
MYLDLHTHSTASDDSKASVEQFAQWVHVLRRKGFSIDGFVLTEHRQFDLSADYSKISEQYNVLILKGAELDTDCGHFLVYGIDKHICDTIDFKDINLNAEHLVEICRTNSAIAIPAHPGRDGIGLLEYIDTHPNLLNEISVLEGLNFSNRPHEDKRARDFINKFKYKNIGGSDSHIVSSIGQCMTYFESNITSEADLVQALKTGYFKAVHIEDTI